MTKSEFDTKVSYRVGDFMNALGLSQGKAYKLMREIKSVSDISGICGLVLREDWERFISKRTQGEGA